MPTQSEKAKLFHSLHRKGDPVVLFNIWDPGTAKIVAGAGARALATGSHPVASAFGFADGEKIPLDLALENFRRIAEATDLPVTMDFESGYARDPEGITRNVARALDAGAVGINFEDQIVGGEGLYGIAEQQRRLEAARRGLDDSDVKGFLNARTDLFLKAKPEDHEAAHVDQAIERANAYQQAGAEGFFAPGIRDEKLIGALCESVSLPVNIIALPGTPPKERLAELGVARISWGPVPWRRMAAWLEEEARAAIG